MWEILKNELKTQFLPRNSSWVTRDGLWRLKRNITVRIYIKEISYVMLTIGNMVEYDKLHYFIWGLKGREQRELRRQNVKAVNSAIVATNKLGEFDEGADPRNYSHFKKKEKGKEWKKNEKGQATEKKDERGITRESF